jgi:hypothetical protein
MHNDQGENIKRLPVRFRSPSPHDGLSLKVIASSDVDACDHHAVMLDGRLVEVTYLLREGETEVECSHCATRLEPMWVLNQMAQRESRYRRTVERCHEALNRLAERSKTRCECCGQMTSISRSSRARR